MTDSPATLKLFFCEDIALPIASSCDLQIAHQAVAIASKKVPAPLRGGLTTALAAVLDEVFEVPLATVLDTSWKKAVALQDGLEATRADPDKVVVVPLMDHKVTSRHKPHVDVVYGGKSLHRLVFDLDLILDLKGVQLQLRNGRICGLTSGHCAGQGVFSLAGKEIIKRSTPSFALPGRLTFQG